VYPEGEAERTGGGGNSVSEALRDNACTSRVALGLVQSASYMRKGYRKPLGGSCVRSGDIEPKRRPPAPSINKKTAHVTVGVNDFLAGRDSTHEAQGKRTHL